MKPSELKVSSAYILSGVTGILFVLLFPPFNFHLLAWVCLVPLLVAASGRTPLTAFKCGIVAGFMYFGGVMPWLINVMNEYGHISNWLSFILMMVLVAYMSLYIGLFAWSAAYYRLSADWVVLSPFLFVTLEYLRGHLLTGYPWALLAHSQHLNPAVIQIASITGVYGVTFIIVLVNSAIAHYLLSRDDARLSSKLLAGALLIAVVNTTWGFWKAGNVESAGGKTFKAAIIQGNIDQGIKWDSEFREAVLSKYFRLTLRAAKKRPDLIVWPETAVPFYYGRDMESTQRLRALVRKISVPLIFGGLGLLPDVTRNRYDVSNRAFLLRPEGEAEHYDKMHLVPFGEYVPLRRILFFVDKITDAVRGDISAGSSSVPLSLNGISVGIQICYEIIFAEPSRAFVRNGASVIVNITNDAWFGNTAASAQHMMSLPFRAVENRI
ncbi:MAG: apolipoprotein N-acyltransferase, partial [Nitrospinota bacterium]